MAQQQANAPSQVQETTREREKGRDSREESSGIIQKPPPAFETRLQPPSPLKSRNPIHPSSSTAHHHHQNAENAVPRLLPPQQTTTSALPSPTSIHRPPSTSPEYSLLLVRPYVASIDCCLHSFFLCSLLAHVAWTPTKFPYLTPPISHFKTSNYFHTLDTGRETVDGERVELLEAVAPARNRVLELGLGLAVEQHERVVHLVDARLDLLVEHER